jgi:hypothetical protein
MATRRRKVDPAAAKKEWTVFVSHAGTDTWVARQIARHLEAVGATPFLDASHIAVGEPFEGKIKGALEQARELIVLLTPWSLQRPYVWIEVGAAFYKGIPLVGVLHGLTADSLRAQQPAIPIALLERNLIDLNDLDRYFDQLKGRIAQEP